MLYYLPAAVALCLYWSTLAPIDGLIGHDPLAAEKQLVDKLLQVLRAPAPFSDLAGDRPTSLAAGARLVRGELIGLSDMISRSFFTHIKVPKSVVFASRDGDEDRAAS